MAVDATDEVMREKPVMIVWEFAVLHMKIYWKCCDSLVFSLLGEWPDLSLNSALSE